MYRKIPTAVKKGLLSENDVDKSLKRLLVTRYKLGMFEEKGSDEGKLILGAISPSDTLVIFDEKGSRLFWTQ